jgi:uncharacterized protein
MEINNNLNHCVERLSKIFGTEKPLGKLYKTEFNFYLYDSGTNQILKCDELTYSLLHMLFNKGLQDAIQDFIKEKGEECLKNTVLTLTKSISRHNLFKLYKVTNFNLFPGKKELEESINFKCNMLELEVTEQCNLRCFYCVYNEEQNS